MLRDSVPVSFSILCIRCQYSDSFLPYSLLSAPDVLQHPESPGYLPAFFHILTEWKQAADSGSILFRTRKLDVRRQQNILFSTRFLHLSVNLKERSLQNVSALFHLLLLVLLLFFCTDTPFFQPDSDWRFCDTNSKRFFQHCHNFRY